MFSESTSALFGLDENSGPDGGATVNLQVSWSFCLFQSPEEKEPHKGQIRVLLVN